MVFLSALVTTLVVGPGGGGCCWSSCCCYCCCCYVAVAIFVVVVVVVVVSFDVASDGVHVSEVVGIVAVYLGSYVVAHVVVIKKN